MINKLKTIFTKQPKLNIRQLQSYFNDDSQTFIELNKNLNELINQQLVFFYHENYYFHTKYISYQVSIKHNLYYLDHKVIFISNDSMINDCDQVLLEKLSEDKYYYIGTLRAYLNQVVGYFEKNKYYHLFKILYPRTKITYKMPLKTKISFKHIYQANINSNQLENLKVLGKSDDLAFRIQLILKQYHLSQSFTQKSIELCQNFNQEINQLNYPDHKDLTNDYFVTIDGPDSKDFDDAVYLKTTEKGYLLKVAIADVSNYVLEGSCLDQEAYIRGTSIYFLNQVIPMLPKELSNDLCSLVPLKNRLALVLSLEYDLSGHLLDYHLVRAIIKSKKRLTYSQVNELLCSDSKDSLVKMLKKMHILSNLIRAKRLKLGSLSFNDDECTFTIQDHQIIDVSIREKYESNLIIEDFMIEANQVIAQICDHLSLPCLYRNHEKPKALELNHYLETIKLLGYNYKNNQNYLSALMLQKSLNYFLDTKYYDLLSELLLKSMSKALYETTSKGHFALALNHYCHFTSPIRRYPDLLVHRYLSKYYLNDNYEGQELDVESNSAKATNCNNCEKIAIEVERTMNDLAIALYMKDKVGQVYDVKIAQVTEFGLFVKLAFGASGLIHISSLKGYFEYSNISHSLISKDQTYYLGQELKAVLSCVDIYKGKLEFKLLNSYNRRNEKKNKRYYYK